jgi:hypothetical protein
VKHLPYVPLYGRLLFLPTNIKLGWKMLAKDKFSTLLQTFINYACKMFYNIGPMNNINFVPIETPKACTEKLFTVVIKMVY